MEALETRPLVLTRAQRLLFWLTAAIVALTRLPARSRTLWDWDEVQFAMAVEEFDVVEYRPHPPGFPLFILLAKLVRPLAASDFDALQAVTLAAAMLLFPVVFLFCRELRFPFAVAWSGALLTSFLPNLWFYGGTAFSDIPSLVITTLACALLLRGIRDPRYLVAGALVLGLAAAVRPQALLAGCAPALLAAWKNRRQWRALVISMILGGLVIAAAYGGAALASASIDEYLETGRKLREYLRQVDSFLSPSRPPLARLAGHFFIQVIPGDGYARVLLVAAVAGAFVATIRREGNVLLLIATFLPFQLFAWLMLDYHSVTRYGVSFAPMYGVLAAAAAVGVVAWIPGLGRGSGAVVVLLFTAALARWSLPALAEVRRNTSPSWSAMRWVDQSVPRSSVVYVHGSVRPFATYLLRRHELRWADWPEDLEPRGSAHAIVVTEAPSPALSARRFVRERARLFDIARQRFFEVTVLPAQAWAQFGEGWYGEEWVGRVVWIWMGERSLTRLPPLPGPARLRLQLEPVLEKGPPTIEVHLNSELVERFVANAAVDRTWIVPARNESLNELVITADRSVNPARDGTGDDGRDLSLRLLGYDWGPAK